MNENIPCHLNSYTQRLIQCLILFVSMRVLDACRDGYTDNNGKITFNGRAITDPHFVVLSNEFAKDSLAAYYKEKQIEGADLHGFTAVDEHYAKDRYKVYYCDEYREGQNYYLTKRQTITTLASATAAFFVSVRNGYAKDNQYAYTGYHRFSVKDIASFTSINPHFSKDHRSAYLDGRAIAGSNGQSFALLENHFAKDTAQIYYYGYTSSGENAISRLPCQRSSFRALDHRYSRNTSTVFFLGFVVKGADANSFQVLASGYSKDKQSVFFEQKKMAGIPSDDFLVYPENERFHQNVVYAKNKRTVFMNDIKMTGADPAGFKLLGGNYAADRSHVYFKMNLVKGPTTTAFKVYPHDFGDADAADGDKKFHEGRMLPVED